MDVTSWPRSVFTDCNEEIIAWLQQCFDKMVAGEELLPNPFYERNEKLTPEVISNVIGAIETKYKYELSWSYQYHLKQYDLPPVNSSEEAAKLLRRPEFDALPYQQQFAIIQGMDEIYVRYRQKAKEVAESAEGKQEAPIEWVGEDYNYG